VGEGPAKPQRSLTSAEPLKVAGILPGFCFKNPKLLFRRQTSREGLSKRSCEALSRASFRGPSGGFLRRSPRKFAGRTSAYCRGTLHFLRTFQRETARKLSQKFWQEVSQIGSGDVFESGLEDAFVIASGATVVCALPTNGWRIFVGQNAI